MTDLESPKGDRSLTSGKSVGVKSKGNPNSGIKPVTQPDSPANCDKGVRVGEKEKEAAKESKAISFSVSYFSWTVSSSEDEAEQVTIALDRMKLRRTSRERNEKRRDSANLT